MPGTGPTSVEDLAFATISELRAWLDAGAISALDLATLAIDRLEHIGPALNAVASVPAERAVADARRYDAARGRHRPSSALGGIPYGAKDLLAARGGPTTYGSAAFKDQVLDFDAAPVRRLSRAGAILVAKLAMMELAGFHSSSTAASLHGPGRNPWDPSRWSAGSSSGSGSAVAAGLVPFALGSETGGSIGSPSAFCGLTGLRPTYGRVSRFRAMALADSLDKIGPMAHSAEDCAMVLECVAGYDRRDPTSRRRSSFRRSDVERAEHAQSRPMRIAFAPSDFEEAADPAVRSPLLRARQAFGDLGFELVQAALPDRPYLQIILDVLAGEGGTNFAGLIEGDDFHLVKDEEQRARMRGTLGTTARTYIEAIRARDAIREDFRHVFTRADVILTYTLPWEPPSIDEPLKPAPTGGGFTAMVSASNLADLPALFLPVGLSERGLPVGVQLVGPPMSDAVLVAIGQRFQAATAWHRLRPAHPLVSPATDIPLLAGGPAAWPRPNAL